MANIDIPELKAMQAQLNRMEELLARAVIYGPPEWMKIEEAADALGVTASTIRRKIAKGELEAKGTGKTKLVRIGA